MPIHHSVPSYAGAVMPPRLRPRWRQGPSVLLGLLATAAIPAAFTGPPGLRLAIIGPLVLAGPGGAAALWLAHGARRQPTDNPPPAGFYLAVTIATSLAAATLIATAMVYGQQWHPAAGVCILAGLTLTLLTGPHLKRAHPTTRRS